MKSSDVLKRYKAGARNFQGLNLRGQSFKEQDLSGADFSEADIQSANFTDANLRGTNFTGAKCGLQKRRAIFLTILSWLLVGISGFISIYSIYSFLVIFDFTNSTNRVAGLVGLLVLVFFLIFIICQGIRAGTIAVVFAVAGAGTAAAVLQAKGVFTLAAATVLAGVLAVAFTVAVTLVFAVAVAFTVAVVFAGALVVAIAFVVAVVFAGAAAVGGAGTGVGVFTVAFVLAETGEFALAVVFTFAVAAAGMYIGGRTMKGDKRYAWVRSFAIAFAAIGGTSFRGADLTDANFAGARLKSTDFRSTDLKKTNLTRVRWYGSKMIDRVRPGATYLKNEPLRQLLITGQGQNKNFNRLDLRGVNLQGANLEKAKFIDTDFYQASLQEANLSRAILIRANFERADLRGADLTGSCIQDWTISKDTKLDGIICDFVYLKLVKGDKEDRMPPRGKFKAGGFVLFIKYLLDTIDIYHDRDINPRLALTVLRKISKDYHEPLDIVALGKRDERIFIKVKVSENVDQERLKEDYFSRYDRSLKLLSANPKQLPSVDELVENKIAEIASEESDKIPSINVTHIEYIKTPNDVIIKGEVTVENMETGGDTFNAPVGIGKVINGSVQANNISGVSHETQSKSLTEAAVEIQQLLKQLSETYPTTTSREKNIVVGEAVDRIESNPKLKAKVINALKAGGTEVFKEAIDHPLVNILVATIEGWQDAE